MYEIFDAFDNPGEFRTTGVDYYNSLYQVTNLATNAIASVDAILRRLLKVWGF